MSPTAGPYGTEVSIFGEGLGSAERSGVQLVVGESEQRVVTPDDLDVVSAWSELRIDFRFPFPLEGPVVVQTSQGRADAGSFTPSWQGVPIMEIGPAVTVLASMSPGQGRIALLLDGTPPAVVEIGPENTTVKSVDAVGVDVTSLRLFSNDVGEVHALGLTDTATPEVVQLKPDGTTLTAEPTGLVGSWETVLVSGGPSGGFVWMRDASGWSRASSDASFAVELGPIADPAPAGGLRTEAATSDGALHVAWNVATGNVLDDMEAPYLASVKAGTSAFEAKKKVGNSMDDYLTEIALSSRGAGLFMTYCASDVDPVLHTPADDVCKSWVRSSEGASPAQAFAEDEHNLYVFTPELVAAAQCTADGLVLSVDGSQDPADVVAWPCPRLLAVEIDSAGYFLPIVEHDGRMLEGQKRPAK